MTELLERHAKAFHTIKKSIYAIAIELSSQTYVKNIDTSHKQIDGAINKLTSFMIIILI